MPEYEGGPIETDNAALGDLSRLLALGRLMPIESGPRVQADTLAGLPSLPDRFNAAFLDHGWLFVGFACGHQEAESALAMLAEGEAPGHIDAYLASAMLAIEPIKWQALKLLGGGLAEPRHPVRAAVVERVFEAWDAGDHLVVVPLVLMLVDGFGVSVTGTKSIFAESAGRDVLFEAAESVAGHPWALKALLDRLRAPARGYSEVPLTLPLRNGVLHGTRLSYADPVVSAKALNLLAAVVEWGRDTAPEDGDDAARVAWNARFLRANLKRLAPHSPDRALLLLRAALSAGRATDAVALIDYHPVHTALSAKILEWREVAVLAPDVEATGPWEVFGAPGASDQRARCHAIVSIRGQDGARARREHVLHAARSIELARADLPSAWRVDLSLLGAIRRLAAEDILAR